jgi:hypothetical protein
MIIVGGEHKLKRSWRGMTWYAANTITGKTGDLRASWYHGGEDTGQPFPCHCEALPLGLPPETHRSLRDHSRIFASFAGKIRSPQPNGCQSLSQRIAQADTSCAKPAQSPSRPS